MNRYLCQWYAVACVALAAATGGTLRSDDLSVGISLESRGPGGQYFLLTGLPPAALEAWRKTPPAADFWGKLFPVRIVLEGATSSTSMLGDYELVEQGLRFIPRYPLRAGATYRVTFEPPASGEFQGGGAARKSQDFALPRIVPATPTRLTSIYPSGDVLPENLLKFYLHFSAPMSRGEAYRRIQLTDGRGVRIEYPFLELAEELWSPDGQRFTLYFDPGRIKRGLKPRELFGPALKEGESYTLTVDTGWPDANDLPLATTVAKKFRVVAPDERQPDPSKWSLTSPPAGSREPLTVVFDEPLDAAMLQRVLEVRDSGQRRIAGRIRLEEQEKRWLFLPSQAWTPGNYRLVVASTLEDRAGNSIGRPFEVDVFRPANPAIEAATVELSFRIH